jgi:RNA polymerase sigma-70 factor (ECF subfamily)
MTDAHDPSPAAAGFPSLVDWDRLLAVHECWLRKVIWARTGEAEAVEEVYQEIALAAIEQKSPLADPAKVGPWLHRLAVIQSARYRRQRGRDRKAVRRAAERYDFGNGHLPDLLAWLVAKERVERTRTAIARLAGRDAEILLLKYGERWSYRQIAERLGISEKAVDSRLMRARARLRHEVIELGIVEQVG